MKTKIVTILILSLISLCLTLPAAALETGKAAPEFKLTDIKGNTHSLSDFKGKTVVLEWLNHSCPFVKKHYGSKNMQNLQSKYTADGVVWLAINSSAEGKSGFNTPAEEQKLADRVGSAATAILTDADGTVGKLYAAKTTPHMYVIDQNGVLRYQGAIDSVNSTDADDITGATNYVSQALDELAAGKDVSVNDTQAYGCSVKYSEK